MTAAESRIVLESFMNVTASHDSAEAVPLTRTDTKILRAAATVISEVGERNLTIDQVADRAGFTRMTVFRRFGSREQLLLATYSHELRLVLDVITEAADSSHTRLDRAVVVVSRLIDSAESNPLFQRLVQVEPAAILDLWRGAGEFKGQEWGAALISGLLQDPRLPDPLEAAEANSAGDLLMRLVMTMLFVPPAVLRATETRGAYLRGLVEYALSVPSTV